MDSRSANKDGALMAAGSDSVNCGTSSYMLAGGSMYRNFIFCSVLLLSTPVCAQDKSQAGNKAESEAKAVSGMSIVGNNESPKSLYIVPWNGSELGAETRFNSSLLDDSTAPVDKEVFMRALDYYEFSNAN